MDGPEPSKSNLATSRVDFAVMSFPRAARPRGGKSRDDISSLQYSSRGPQRPTSATKGNKFKVIVLPTLAT